ncbi:MAG: hypothetical protein LBD86_07785 [Spirochaetaceae bacterium]|jgi:hypothetical protein|nr:hypothetical protein [Spirochaetaceae bacterium]
MTKKKFLWGMLVVVLVFGVVLSGCATRIGDFTLISSKNVDLSQVSSYSRSKKIVRGSDSIITVLFFIPIKSKVDIKKALDNALAKIPGAEVIVDARFDYRKLNFILFQIEGFVVSGTALVNPNVVDASETTPDKPYLVMDTKDGEHFTKRYVSEDEYRYLLTRNNTPFVFSTVELQGDI